MVSILLQPFSPGAEGGPLLDVIEGCLSRLLEASLEDSTFQALQANLQGGDSGSAAGAAGLALPAGSVGSAPAPSAAVAQQSLALAPLGAAQRGGAAGGAAAAAAALAEGRMQAAAMERCSLLNILTLIYYHPRKQCTPERFLSLAKLFHSHLFTRALPRAGGAGSGGEGGEPAPAQLSIKLVRLRQGYLTLRLRKCCEPVLRHGLERKGIQVPVALRWLWKVAQQSHTGSGLPMLCTASSRTPTTAAAVALPAVQATLLLLEMLDVDKALAALAAEQPIDEAVRWAAGRGTRVCGMMRMGRAKSCAMPAARCQLFSTRGVLTCVGRASQSK